MNKPSNYIKHEGKKKINVKIPKDSDPKALSRDECIELMNNQLKAKKK